MANPSPLLQFVEALDQVADKADVDVEAVIQKLIAAHNSVGERAFWGYQGGALCHSDRELLESV